VKWSRQGVGSVTEAASRNTTGVANSGMLRTATCVVVDDSQRAGGGNVGYRVQGLHAQDGLQTPLPASLAHILSGRPGLSCMGAAGAETNSARVRARLQVAGAWVPHCGLTRTQSSYAGDTKDVPSLLLGVASSGALCTRGHASASTSNNVFPAEPRLILSVACTQSSSFHHPVGAIL